MLVLRQNQSEKFADEIVGGFNSLPSLRLTHLHSFLAAAEHLHFGRAAESIHLTQPVLSRHISSLERSLDAKLFDRTTRNVQLTSAGEVLIEEARAILSQVERAALRVRHNELGLTGTVRVGIVASSALSVIHQVSDVLNNLGPNVNLRFIDAVTDDQLPRLRRGALDIGVMREVYAAPELEVRPLARERLVLAVPADHRLARRKTVPLSELAAEQFVMSPRSQAPRLVDHLVAICRGAGFEPNIVHESLQFTTILGLVSAGAGVSIVPEPLTSITLAGLRFVKLADDDAFSQLSYAYRPAENSSALMKRAVTQLEHAFGQK